jgi:hypothetical protein
MIPPSEANGSSSSSNYPNTVIGTDSKYSKDTHSIFINIVALPLLIIALMKISLLDPISDIDML